MATHFTAPGQQFLDVNGNPYSGGKLYFYVASTTTPQNTFSDSTLVTPLSNPVILDSAGRSVQIFMSATTYRVQLKTSADVLVADWDNVDSGLGTGTGALAVANGGTGANTAAGARTNLGLGTAAVLDSGTGPGNVVILNGSSQLPAIDGSQLTGFTASQISGISPSPGSIWGLTTSNNALDASNDIDFATGFCTDSTNASTLTLAGALTKQLDVAWAVGTNAGMLDTGAVAVANTYHLFVIKRVDTGVVDILASLSPTAPTMPASYTLFRRIASITRIASVNRAYVQVGDEFLYLSPVTDLNFSTLAVTTSISTTLSVPTGLTKGLWAILSYRLESILATQTRWIWRSLDETDVAPSAVNSRANVASAAAYVSGDPPGEMMDVIHCRVGSTPAIFMRASVANAVANTWTTMGYVDLRGKLF